MARSLIKKQKKLIEEEAAHNYSQDNKYMFVAADTLRCYDKLNEIKCYESMDSDIERHYSDSMSMVTRMSKEVQYG
jgi:hypothetical protein